MYKEYLLKLKEICKKKKFKLKLIGYVGFKKEFPIFSVIINDIKRPKRTIVFSAGIHGEEPTGPFAILKFLEDFNLNRYKNIKIIIFPVANPHGFDRGIRRNFLNKDLNGHFCNKKLSGENKILYNFIKNENIFFFHALHEDEEEKKFYLYLFEKNQEKVYRDIIKLAEKYFLINRNKKIYNDHSINGLIINRKDGSFEDRLFRDGVKFSMCTETPGKMFLSKRVDLNVRIMNLVIKFAESN